MEQGAGLARHRVCCIVPGKVLRRLADEVKDAAERSELLDSALASEALRGQRAAFGLMGLVGGGLPAGEERRTVYDAGHKQRLPGKLVRGEGGPPSADATVNEAYDGAGATYDFYRTVLQRNSIDGHGLRIDSSVHYRVRFNNAFWNGRQMVYGDGDGKIFTGFASALDVVAHELTHGVTQYTVPHGGLVYEGESGALNESMSDVFGILVKQWKLGLKAVDSDWLIGAGIMSPEYGKALRSMKDPGTAWKGDDQPGDMSGYVPDGDVHTNSGIPNHAFYLAASALGGYAWEKAGRIWYRALQALQPTATFADAARATVGAAAALFGAGSGEQRAVQNAWTAVKVNAT